MVNRNPLALLVAVLLVCACAAPARISSNKAADYSREPKRVFIMTDIGSEWGNEYYNAFRTKLAALLTQCGAASQVSRISDLELDENLHLRRAAAFKADVILQIRRNGGTKNQYGSIINVIYDSRLMDIDTKKVVWRSSAHFVRGLTPLAERGEQLAIDITNKMKEDGIFHACPVVKTVS